MTGIRKLALLSLFILLVSSLRAQVEVAHLFSKGFSATGFGTFLHGGFSLPNNGEVSLEVGLYYFGSGSNHLAFAPILAGYRHFLDGSGTGFYIEPNGGYAFGGTDIVKTDVNGSPIYDASGKEIDQKISGPVAGLGLGYILPSPTIPLNFSLRYTHLFISGDPSQNMLSFRISWSLIGGRKAAK